MNCTHKFGMFNPDDIAQKHDITPIQNTGYNLFNSANNLILSFISTFVVSIKFQTNQHWFVVIFCSVFGIFKVYYVK